MRSDSGSSCKLENKGKMISMWLILAIDKIDDYDVDNESVEDNRRKYDDSLSIKCTSATYYYCYYLLTIRTVFNEPMLSLLP